MTDRAPYRFKFGKVEGRRLRPASAGVDFRLDEQHIREFLLRTPGKRQRDLLRIGMAVYVADRLERRVRKSVERGGARELNLDVDVQDWDFWSSDANSALVRQALRQLSGDDWHVRFTPGGAVEEVEPFLRLPEEPSGVCLYSGGLDSAAGLATRLRTRAGPMIAVTANHQPGQRRRVTSQLDAIGRRYEAHVYPLVVRTTLVKPPRMDRQELTQRCRSFLFMSLGGVVANFVGTDSVEVYENGVGALNLPLMSGMLVGSRATRATHPAFLRTMSELLTRVAERPIKFDLPFRHHTKAEITRTLKEDGLDGLARSTVSCMHYPLRIRGTAKQCGCCPGCIGRRQALLASGTEEDPALYVHDLFGDAQAVNNLPFDNISYLKATLMQVAELAGLEADGSGPDIFRRHVSGTGLLECNESVSPWVDVMRRYREEWLKIVAWGHSRGWHWADWLAACTHAA